MWNLSMNKKIFYRMCLLINKYSTKWAYRLKNILRSASIGKYLFTEWVYWPIDILQNVSMGKMPKTQPCYVKAS